MTVDRPAPDTVRIRVGGAWRLGDRLPPLDAVVGALAQTPDPRLVVLEAEDLTAWDTGLLSLVMKVLRHCAGKAIAVDRRGLPSGINGLVSLASAVSEKPDAPPPARLSWLARFGVRAVVAAETMLVPVRFLGEVTLSLTRAVAGRAQMRWQDLLGVVQEAGPRAVPIVTLISFLVGLILAFTASVQLRTVGGQVFVADLVAIAGPREMGCLMTAVIMAGRTGAAFAAQLGTMRVNEEIDAFLTMGIKPMDFLVLPRMLGLIATMPVLTVYADLVTIVGGGVVGVVVLGIPFAEYVDRTVHVLTMTNVFLGVIKATVFGVLVALCGCLRGMRSERNAAAVGLAATSAVVTAIVLIVAAEGLFAVICSVLDI